MRIIRFNNHLDCPYLRPAWDESEVGYCKKMGRALESLEPIPDWCPLEHASQPPVQVDAEHDAVCPKCGAALILGVCETGCGYIRTA